MMGELRYQNLRDPPAHLREQETPHSTQTSPRNNTSILTKVQGEKARGMKNSRKRTGGKVEMLHYARHGK